MAPQQKYVDWKIVGTLKPSPQLDLIIILSDGLKVPLILLVVFEPKPLWLSFLIPVEIIILLVSLSSYNKKDIEEINQKYLKGVKFIYVDSMTEVIDNAMTNRKVLNHKVI